MAFYRPEFGSENENHLVLGQYTLLHEISKGMGGTVWKASDKTKRELALKFLNWSPIKDKELVAGQFKNEFAILKNLSHPHISKIYDFGFDPQLEKYFFTTELFPHGDLSTLVMAEVNVIEDLLLQALRALEYLRNQQLLHLDIKPQNLLLRKKGKHPELALIDFGLASFRENSRAGGTPNYMPPEMVAHLKRFSETFRHENWQKPDHRSDLYSLGVTFYYLLTGIQPFDRKKNMKRDMEATLLAHMNSEPKPPSAYRQEIPHYLDRIILKLMAKNPDDRYSTSGIAAQALQYRSPHQHQPESKETLLAYLPKKGKLIGRKKEHLFLENVCEQLRADTSHIPVLALTGPTGIGKTRLLEYVKAYAQQQEMFVHHLDLSRQENLNTLEEMLEKENSSEPFVHCVLIDDLDLLFDEKNGFGQKEELLHGLKHLLKKLELQQKIKDKENKRYLLLCTLNSERLSPESFCLNLGLKNDFVTSLELNPFSHEEVSEYLENLLGEKPEESVVDQLLNVTEGNPLYLTEHLEQMISRGKLFTLAGRPDAKTLKQIGIDFSHSGPSKSLKETTLNWYQQLEPKLKTLAAVFSCWKRAVSLNELEACLSDATCITQLPHLVESAYIKRNEDATYTFNNGMVAKIISQTLPNKESYALHDAIVTVLSAEATSQDELDYYLAHGSKREVRVEALKRLIPFELKHNHNYAAIDYCRQLYTELSEDNLNEKVDCLIHLSNLYERAQQDDLSFEALQKIEQLQVPEKILKTFSIKALEQKGLLSLRKRNTREAEKYFHEALKLVLFQEYPDAWKIRLSNYLASVELRAGKAKSAATIFEQNATAAKKLPKKQQDLVDNNELGETLFRLGKAKDAIPILMQELQTSTQHAAEEKAASKHYLLGEAYRHPSLQEFSHAMKHYKAALKIASEHHLLQLNIRVLNGMGSIHLLQQKPKQAAKHYREALTLSQHIESETVTAEIMVNLGFILSELGEASNAAEYLEAALDFSSGPKGKSSVFVRKKRAEILIALGDALYHQKKYERAEHYLLEAMNYDNHEHLSANMRYSLYGTLVEIYLESDRKKNAEGLLATLKSLTHEVPEVPEVSEHFKQLQARF